MRVLMSPVKGPQFHVRLPGPLHEALRDVADEENLSLNTLVVRLLAQSVPVDTCPLCDGTGKVGRIQAQAKTEALALLATAQGMTAKEQESDAAERD
jgi:hypothetical protein